MQRNAPGILDSTHEFNLLWRHALSATPRAVRVHTQACASEAATELAGLFYDTMLTHDHAKLFLDNGAVNERLRASMTRWITQLFATLDEEQIPAAVAYQIQVGTVHARINLPVELMQMGFQVLAGGLRQRCIAAFSDQEERIFALGYIADVLHIADSLMLVSFVRDLQFRVRREEAYRLISMDHDATLERERQRAALSEWFSRLVMSLRYSQRGEPTSKLGDSEFGLWLKHKAPVFFDGIPELDHVYDVLQSIDEIYLPQLLNPAVEESTLIRLMGEVERKVDFIRYLLNDLFARLNKSTLGRDTVTRLLNQRYLPTILSREITAHERAGKPFSVILVRIDRLRKVVLADDRASRDSLLQQLSVAIVESVRAGDHAFRYSDEEFLIVLVETDLRKAADLADDLRLRIRSLEFHLQARTVRHMTVSIGIAQFDGHPDYQYLVHRAEMAVAKATNEGGDRVELGAMAPIRH